MSKKRRTEREIRDENKLLRRAVGKLSAALAFYASEDTYFAIGFLPDAPCGDFIRDFSKTEMLGFKPGKRARKVLDALQAEWEVFVKARQK